MWLADDKNPPKQSQSTVPPLQGGESLCEFYGESSSNIHETFEDLHISSEGTTPPYQVTLSPPHDDFVPVSHESSLLTLFGQAELASANTFTHTFLQSILSSVESKDPVVASAWMETLLDVIDLLPKDVIKRDILTLAVNKGQISQSVSSRLLGCKVLGKICSKFDPYIIRKEILPVVQSLCQDTDHEVRAAMCRQLDAVARGIGLEATKNAILPELVELANDEESIVRLAGIETVVHILQLLDDETCSFIIIPLVRKFCENALKSEDLTLPLVAKQLGQLCHGLSGTFSIEQGQWFFNFYCQLAKMGLHRHLKKETHIQMPDVVPVTDSQDRYIECRQACAFNLPAMMLLAGTEHFQRQMFSTFTDLSTDPSYLVRKTVACGFHEIAKLLDTDAYLLLGQLISLLKDDFIEVLEGLMPHLPESLTLVTKYLHRTENKEQRLAELVHALVICEIATAHTTNWRLHEDFLKNLSCLSKCLSSEQIHTSFVPLLFNKLHTVRPIPCRMAALYSLLVFLRNTPHLTERQEIIKKLINDLCRGHSCHKRMLFIRMSETVMTLFSKSFFKRYFFKPLLGLSNDRVANIRLRLCTLLPQLKSLLQMPTDARLLQDLEACVRSLMTDETDRDVVNAVRKAIEELDEIEVALDSVIGQRTSVSLPIDLEDFKKQEEEKKLFGISDKRTRSNKNESLVTRSLPRRGKIPLSSSSSRHSPGVVFSDELNTRHRASTLPKNFPSRNTSKRSSNNRSPSNNDKYACSSLPATPLGSPKVHNKNTISVDDIPYSTNSFTRHVIERSRIPAAQAERTCRSRFYSPHRAPSPFPTESENLSSTPSVNQGVRESSGLPESSHRYSTANGSRIPTPRSSSKRLSLVGNSR